jgi:hypothetical protein
MTRPIAGWLAAVLVLAPACAGVPAQREPRILPAKTIEPRGPALILGDSIMRGAADIGRLGELLEDSGFEPEVVAEVSQTVPWGTEQIELRSSVPEVVVVGLGTNPGSDLRDFAQEVDSLVAALTSRGAVRIYWVPPVDADPERYSEKHHVLVEDGRLIVVDWPAEAARHPEWFGTDGLHLTTEGYIALASFIAKRVR